MQKKLTELREKLENLCIRGEDDGWSSRTSFNNVNHHQWPPPLPIAMFSGARALFGTKSLYVLRRWVTELETGITAVRPTCDPIRCL